MAGFRLSATTRGFLEARSRFAKFAASIEGRQLLAVKRAALLAEREIKKGIQRGAPGGKTFKPLSDVTQLLRPGGKPLMDSGSLLGSITTMLNRVKKEAFVGVHRSAKNGAELVNVAIAHEFGTKPYQIPVTPGVRRFFWYLHFKSKGKIKPLSESTTVINHPGVPPRPFIKPTIESIRPKLQAAVRAGFTQGGLL